MKICIEFEHRTARVKVIFQFFLFSPLFLSQVLHSQILHVQGFIAPTSWKLAGKVNEPRTQQDGQDDKTSTGLGRGENRVAI
jgi:hypothetical protein